MRKKYFYSAMLIGLAGLALHGAGTLTNRNVLSKGPVMSGDFARPEIVNDAERGAAEKAALEAAERGLKLAPAVNRAADGSPLPVIVASVYDYTANSIGMYQLPELVGGEMVKLSDVSSYYGGALNGSTYYACHDGRYVDYWDTDNDPHGHKIQGYDINTWTPVGDEVYLSTYRSSDMAIDPATGKAWAFCDYGSMMYNLYEIDLTTGVSTRHAPASSMMPEESSRALAFDAEGELWGVTKNGKFGKIDRSTGVNSATYTLSIGDSPLRYNWTGCFDPDSGNFIYIWNGNVNAEEVSIVYSLNPATGAQTELARFADKCITSMYIASTPVADKAPGAPVDLKASFPNGALTGTVTFTMPAALHDGSAASGDATWTVNNGKEVAATGTAAYGAEVSTDVTVTAGGKLNFSAAAKNDAGEGKKARMSLWVGPDVPKAPANVAVAYDEAAGTYTVSWDAVTEGANGGYVDAEAVSYTVVRQPGDVKVAEGVSGTTCTDTYTPDGIESITFSVTATQGTLTSEAAVSEPVVSGSLKLPYTMTEGVSSNYDIGKDWTIIDANNDGSTWQMSYDGPQCKYNSTNSGDDWFVSPPIKAYPASKYRIKIKVAAYGWSEPSSYPERVEVKMGYAPTAEAMTETLVEPTVVTNLKSNPLELDFEAKPTQEGKFFIGVHAISDPDQYYLYLKDVIISAPESTEGPAAVTDFAVTADPTGALKVSGKGIAPTQTAQGHLLPSISKIEVSRQGTVVATITDAEPGKEFTFTDETLTEEGEVAYTAVAYAGELNGTVCEAAKAYVGINYPGEVSGLTITPNADGTVTATWNAPETDRDGYPMNGSMSYQLEVYPDNAYYHGNATYDNITETSYTFTPAFEGGRDHGFVYVKVWGVSSKGAGFYSTSANLPVGKALKLPFKESFPNYTLEHPWGDGESNGPQIGSISDDERSLQLGQYNGWNRMMDKSFTTADGAQDGDNGFAGMFGWSYVADTEGRYHDEYTELISPLISLEGETAPMLSFYVFNWLDATNGKCLNELAVDVVDSEGRHPAKTLVVGDLGASQAWEHVAVDLSPYAGKVISLVFTGTIKGRDDKGYNWILLDNIRIETLPDTDLAVDALSAPVMAAPGEAFKVGARVTNKGAKDVAAYTVELLKNGSVAESRAMTGLGFSGSQMVEFDHQLAVTDPVGCDFQVKVTAAGDADEANNVTPVATVGRNLPLLPEPEAVRLSDAAPNVMEWTTPDLTKADPAPFTDDFEQYGNFETSGQFTTDAGDWIFVDADGFPIGGIVSASTWEMIEFPGIPNHSKQSWWVQSRLFEEFNNDYFGHSGVQYLANMYVVNDTYDAAMQQDDWAISPMLCGKQQMVSLWARSYARETPETIELLWSDGGTSPADFQLIRRLENISHEWTQYVAVVPEGAKRFAIRGCSFGEMGTNQAFIDDVTFVLADGEPQALTLKGFNLYKDNVKVNAEPQQALTFALDASPEDHQYAVSAVYDKGESRAVLLGETSLADLNAAGTVTVIGGEGEILIAGLDGEYAVVSTSGIVMARGAGASGQVRVSVPAGVYVVTAAGQAYKVAVK